MNKSPAPNASPVSRGLIARLRTDQTGNALMLTVAAMIPLAGLVGSGVDMGRLYATKTRLQHACDATVLAGRKIMKGNSISTEVTNYSKQFFLSNFPDSKYGTTNSNIALSPGGDGELVGKAQAKVPMSLMKIFGATDETLKVSCSAKLNVSNTDIMMVLDTTGSMELVNPKDSSSRMVSLREAVKKFYSTMETVKSDLTKIRYGFVPYSQTVNVGHLLKPDWIKDKWSYQSREKDKTITNKGELSMWWSTDSWTLLSGSISETSSFLPLENCVGPTDSTYTSSGSQRLRTDTPYAGPPAGTRTEYWQDYTENGYYYWIDQTPTQCKLWKRTYNNYKTTYHVLGIPYQYADYDSYQWKYKQVEYDISGLTVGGSIPSATGWAFSNRDIPWNGCIEERATVKKISYFPIPNDAYDMQIDLVPTGDPKTQWAPWLPDLIWTRQSITNLDRSDFVSQYDTENLATFKSGAHAVCPQKAMKLAEISASDLEAYLASLTPSGKTYHDIGMVWGARLLSDKGLFASENVGLNVSRHLIFMTDGDTDTAVEDYDAYGISAIDRRRASDLFSLPTKALGDIEVALRFSALCKDVKAKNMTVWVIAFGTSLTKMLEECASPGKAFQAANASELNDAFAKIASDIAQLRLVD
jgi:Flp pilus assembly protein TadG